MFDDIQHIATFNVNKHLLKGDVAFPLQLVILRMVPGEILHITKLAQCVPFVISQRIAVAKLSVSIEHIKTSASAGIPSYLDNYLCAEKCTLRGTAIQTTEVANAALFLLSNASSGINAQQIVIDGGMRLNYFDQDIVKPVVESLFGKRKLDHG